MRCQVNTLDGESCPYEAKSVSKETGKNVCNMHLKTCKTNYIKYKKICNDIWNKRCSLNDSPEELKKAIKFAVKCKLQRIDFSKKCCNNLIDKSHNSALLKMDNIIKHCGNSLTKLNDEKY